MESIKVIIKTVENKEEVTQEYTYKGDLNIPVTTLLERLNINFDTKIHYSSSCLQGLCGACSMIINGWPKLACKTFLNEEIITKTTGKITIEPLSKFPIIKDLIVDRSVMFENLKKAQQWLEEDANFKTDNHQLEYEVSQCIMCGCCLEACANYNLEDDYYGVILPVSSSKIIKQETNKDKIKFLKEEHNKHFTNGCTESLICEDICPMNIQTQRAISIMNTYSLRKLNKILDKE